MKNLKPYDLKINNNDSKEDKEIEKYIKIIDKIAKLLYKEKMSIEDSIVVTDCLLSALTTYKMNGYTEINQIEL